MICLWPAWKIGVWGKRWGGAEKTRGGFNLGKQSAGRHDGKRDREIQGSCRTMDEVIGHHAHGRSLSEFSSFPIFFVFYSSY